MIFKLNQYFQRMLKFKLEKVSIFLMKLIYIYNDLYFYII